MRQAKEKQPLFSLFIISFLIEHTFKCRLHCKTQPAAVDEHRFLSCVEKLGLKKV